MNYKKNVIVSILVVLLIIVVFSSTTYAVYKWRSTYGLNVNVNVTDNVIVTFNGGTNITGRLIPVDSPRYGIDKFISVKSNLPSNDTFSLFLKINKLPDELKTDSFKWKLTNGNDIDVSGSFTPISMNDYIDSGTGDMLLLENQPVPFRYNLKLHLYIWIDGTVDNATSMQNKSVDFDLYATGTSNGEFVEGVN